ncbi:ester cyclase [Haloarcula sp. JP-L23]|uniref:ester cyclase n=1 Tax=Haloarcula sp. JP-L23 TaxID=2716717 RepID=UPI001D05933E
MTVRSQDQEENSGNLAVTGRNERLVREYFKAVWNEGDLYVFDTDLVSGEYVLHAQSNDQYTVEELRNVWSDWHRTFPDLSNEIRDLITTDDRVVVRYRFSGTHEAEIMGIPQTGKTIETAGIVILRLKDGQIAETYAMDDVLGLRQQLGENS